MTLPRLRIALLLGLFAGITAGCDSPRRRRRSSTTIRKSSFTAHRRCTPTRFGSQVGETKSDKTRERLDCLLGSRFGVARGQ